MQSDGAAIESLLREALEDNLFTQRRQLVTKSSGKAFVRIEVTARCARASRRQVVAVMGQLEREAAVRSMHWESVLDPTHGTPDPAR